jgi:hypothetical protein
LGKISRQAAKSNATAEIKVNGKTIATMNGIDIKLTTQQLKETMWSSLPKAMDVYIISGNHQASVPAVVIKKKTAT